MICIKNSKIKMEQVVPSEGETGTQTSYHQQALQFMLKPSTITTVTSGIMLLLKVQARFIRFLASLNNFWIHEYIIAFVRYFIGSCINIYTCTTIYLVFPILNLLGYGATVHSPAPVSPSKETGDQKKEEEARDKMSVNSSKMEPPAVHLCEEYEGRKYKSAYWISTRVSGNRHNTSVREGFNRLLQFSQGSNTDACKFDLTCPVVTKISSGPNDQLSMEYIVSTRLPDELQTKPPNSTGTDVNLEWWPNIHILSRKFTGFTPDLRWTEEAESFLGIILDKEIFNAGHYYTAIYGSPYELIREKNEIWFEQKRTVDPPEKSESKQWVLKTAGQFYQTVNQVTGIGQLRKYVMKSGLM